MRTIRKRVATDKRFVPPWNRKLERQILAGLELRERFAIMCLQVNRADVVTLHDLSVNLEFTITIPLQLSLLRFFATQTRFLKLQGKAIHRRPLLGPVSAQ